MRSADAKPNGVGVIDLAAKALSDLGGRLLAAQLRDIADEFDSGSRVIIPGLDAIATAAREIRRISGHAYGASDRQVGSFLVALERDVRQIQPLMANLHESDAAIAGQVRAVLDAARRLQSHVATVRAVEADIRIVGLNTTLKCGRLGAIGRPLSVVAQELRELGTRTSAQAVSMLQALAEMTCLAASLCEPDGARRQAEAGDIGGNIPGALKALASLGQTLSDALAELEADSNHAATLLESAGGAFAVCHKIGGKLHRIAACFSEIGAGACCVAEDVDEPGRDLLARIAATYTMARERAVHAAVVPWAASAVASVASGTDELEDVLF
jgi:hypothetical protein